MLLQSSSNTRKMDLRYHRGSRPAKKEEKDSGRTKPADFPLLTRLVGSSPIRARPRRRTRITNKVSSATEDGDKVAATTPLQWTLTPILSKERRETSPKSSASPAIGRDIT